MFCFAWREFIISFLSTDDCLDRILLLLFHILLVNLLLVQLFLIIIVGIKYKNKILGNHFLLSQYEGYLRVGVGMR